MEENENQQNHDRHHPQEEEIIDPADPMAFYKDEKFEGKPHSKWEAFRRISHKIKKPLYILFFVSIAGTMVVSLLGRGGNPLVKYARNYFGELSKRPADPIYEIDGHYFGASRIYGQYEIIGNYTWGEAGMKSVKKNTSLSGELFSNYLMDQFETDLLALAAIKEGMLDSPRAQVIIGNALKHAMAEYYLRNKVHNPGQDFSIRVTKKEVEEHYEKNREFYEKQGLPKEQVQEIIRKTLMNTRKEEQDLKLFKEKVRLVRQLKESMNSQVYDTPGSGK